MHRIAACASTMVLVATLPAVTLAQESRMYVGGAFGVVNQSQSAGDRLGGATWGASAVLGWPISPRVAVEFEPSFGGRYSWEYSYRPGPSWTADVVASRRDTFFSFLVRFRPGVLEPVIGAGIVSGTIARHATTNGQPYFDDDAHQLGVALAGGLDAALALGRRADLVPSFRLFLIRRADGSTDPLTTQTTTGPVLARFAIGARIHF